MVPSACKLFTGIEDPRVVGRITHSLAEILFAALCATLCGFGCCDGYAQFARAKVDFLRRYLPYEDGTPSHDTFGRLFRLIKPEQFEAVLADLARRVTAGSAGHVAIDGKTVRGSADVARGVRAALVHSAGPGIVGCSSFSGSSTPMPYKHNADRRHHIPKMSFKVRNWPAYEAGLRRRGSLTLWIEDAALGDWQSTGPSGQARYKDAAVQTSLMLRTAFKLALRQTEGLMTSVLTLMGLTLSAPDHTTVSRRAVALRVIQPAHVPPGPLHVLIDSTGLQVYGAGQWLEAKHGAKSHRTWRKLHLAVDAANGMIVAQTLTDQDADDPSQVGPLLGQISDPIVQVTADGAYDGAPTYQTVAAHGDEIEVVIPPRSTAVLSGEPGPPTQRDRHLAMIAEQGRLAWQATTGYGQRSLVERQWVATRR